MVQCCFSWLFNAVEFFEIISKNFDVLIWLSVSLIITHFDEELLAKKVDAWHHCCSKTRRKHLKTAGNIHNPQESLYRPLFSLNEHHCATTTNENIKKKPEKEQIVLKFVHNWIINSFWETLLNYTDLLLNTSNKRGHSLRYSNDLVLSGQSNLVLVLDRSYIAVAVRSLKLNGHS